MMLTVTEAEKILFSHLPEWKTKTVAVADALGCVLQETVIASRAQPPFDRATMDGIAIASRDYSNTFQLQGVQLAGQPITTLKPAQGLQIMTGAVVPHLADCIIPIEQVMIKGNAVVVTGDAPKK